MIEGLYITLQKILTEVEECKKRGDNSYMAKCPCHKDEKPSLSITLKDDRILLNCFAGCKTEEIVENLGLKMSDLFANKKNNNYYQQKVAEYLYYTTQNQLVYKVEKYKTKKGKSFKQYKYTDGKWINNMQDVIRVPYNLPNVIKSDTIYFVEGEKDSDSLNSIGLVSTTTVGGCGSFNKYAKEYCKYFKNKIVYIIPDNDTGGYKYAENIKNSLKGIAKEVKILVLKNKVKDLKEKQDISDVLQRFGKKETLNILEQLINNDDDSIDISVQEKNETKELKNYQIAKIILKENNCKIYNNELYIYSEGFYIRDEKYIYKRILELKPDASAYTRNEIYKYLELYAEEQIINKESDIINFKNGLFDLKKRNIISAYT